MSRLAAILVLPLLLTSPAVAQFQRAAPGGVRLGESETQYWQFGFTFSATGGSCRDIVATQSIPMEWPEQTVQVVDRDVSPGVAVSDRVIDGTVKRMIVKVPLLPAGAEARAVLTFAVTRSHILAPQETSQYRIPERRGLPTDLRDYLLPSPYIESTSSTIRLLARRIAKTPAGNDWERVEAIYDWVYDNIEFIDDRGQAPKTTAQTLKDRTGDCDEKSSLFIALCRASGIPARLVQLPGHVYPEFYLLDAEGAGHWFPCQEAGTRAFGAMPEFRPVLQKGDKLVSPHAGRREYQILPQHVTAASGQPLVHILVQQVDR